MKEKQKFEAICTRLMSMEATSLSSVDFEVLCKEHGADVTQMNNMCYLVFGMAGDEVIQQFMK